MTYFSYSRAQSFAEVETILKTPLWYRRNFFRKKPCRSFSSARIFYVSILNLAQQQKKHQAYEMEMVFDPGFSSHNRNK